MISLTKPFYFSPGSFMWLTSNLIGVIAVVVAWLISFYVAGNRGFRWASLPAVVFFVTLTLFILGLNRSYRFLRGDFEPAGSGLWTRAVFGGFFGGVLAAPIIASSYYLAWSNQTNFVFLSDMYFSDQNLDLS